MAQTVTKLQSRRRAHPSSLRGEVHAHAPSTSIHHMQSQHNVTDAYSNNEIIETHQRSRRWTVQILGDLRKVFVCCGPPKAGMGSPDVAGNAACWYTFAKENETKWGDYVMGLYFVESI